MKYFIRTLLPLVLVAVLIQACDRDEPSINKPAPPVLLPVVMNEVYSRGDATNPDWIEIYNPNTTAIDISGYRIYDSGGQAGTKPKKEIPAGTSLAGMGFYVITVDDTVASGFGLSSGGETVWFENAAGTIIDSVAIPALGVDTSYARIPNGSTNWAKLTLPTKGVSNGSGGSVLPLTINEAYSRGVATDPDWVEIYNPNDAPVTLTGYHIYDPGGNAGTKPKMPFPTGASVPAKGWYVIVVDGSEPYQFGLSSGGDEVWLENPGGTVVDHVQFGAMSETQSYSRIPDGSANWILSNTITRGASNKP